MLKVEYPCREILSSYQNPNRSVIAWAEAKKHLHDVRLRRQNQLAININECEKLRSIHKQIFNRQFDANSIEKPPDNKPVKSINNESSSYTKKYSIPRIAYAPLIYRQAIPTFEVERSIKLENDLPIVKELTEYLTESSCAIPNNKIENHQSLSPIKKDQQRYLSVSSVSSIDKRANKVYEKWPDYTEISEIVGYRIDPPSSKTITSNCISAHPSNTITQRKRNKSVGFPAASKQVKNVVNLNPSRTRRQPSKTKKTDLTPIIIDKPCPTIPKSPCIKQIQPKLPAIICPSSIMYSNRIQTRQWLIKNHFSSNAIRTHPLL